MYVPSGRRGDGCARYGPENTIAGQFPSVLNGLVLYLWAVECPNLFLAGSVSPWGHRRHPLGFAWFSKFLTGQMLPPLATLSGAYPGAPGMHGAKRGAAGGPSELCLLSCSF